METSPLVFSGGISIRYHYEKPSVYFSIYGTKYECDHPVYDECTLFEIDGKGLAVIQQRFDDQTKKTFWSSIDPWLNDVLYLHARFQEFFDERSGECTDGLYPTVTVRQIMWALKLKPLPKERWETCFDRKSI